MALMALVVAAVALVAAGCGGSDNNEASGSTDTTTVTETATETAASTETTSTETSTDTGSSIGTGALSGECKQLAQLGEKFSASLSGQSGDLGDVAKAFDQLAGQVPDEIKPDFQVLAENYKKIAEALKGVDVQSGKAPTADQAAKLQQALTSIDNTKVQAAVTHLEAWAQKNCGS